jgi:hypothetical protein
MKLSHMLVLALGVVGGMALIEYCPKAREMLRKGKDMLKNKNEENEEV